MENGKALLINKPGNADTSQVKAYQLISVLLALCKALETIIIQDIENETNMDSHDEQHGFTTGRSTISASEEVYKWVDASKSRNIFGTFLDITGAFGGGLHFWSNS